MLLVRLFFFLSVAAISAACRAPERRTAKMKISYTFANGENSEVEVNEEISVRLFYKFRGSGFSEQPLIFFRETPPVRHL